MDKKFANSFLISDLSNVINLETTSENRESRPDLKVSQN